VTSGRVVITNTAGDESITSTNGVAIDASNATLGVTLDSVSSGSGAIGSSTNGLSFNNVAGALTVNSGTTVSSAGVDGINVDSSEATFIFNGLTDIDNATGRGVDLRGNNGAITFANVDIDNSTLSDFSVTNNTNAVTVTSGIIDSPSSANGGVALNGGAANVIIGANVTNVNGLAVQVANRTAGMATFNGQIISSGAGAIGVSVQDNSVSLIDFNGQLDIDNQGVSVTNNTVGSQVRFDGGLDINAMTDTGFNANNGGSITVTGANNSVTTTTGQAVVVQNTSTDIIAMTFRSISANGAINGIVLNNVSGSFRVTGDGTTDVLGGFGTGGTIQNTTGPAVLLTSASNVTLQNMNINDSDDDGVRGNAVTDLVILNSSLARNGDAIGEHGVDITGLLGANSRIAGSTITVSAEYNVSVTNSASSTPRAQLTLEGSILANTAANALTGSDCVLFGATNNANMQLTVEESAFIGCLDDGVQVSAEDTATVSAFIRRNNFEDNNRGINLLGSDRAALSFDIDNNTVLRSPADMINVVHSGGNGSATGSIVNNAVNGVTGSGGLGNGIRVIMEGQGATGPTGVVLIDDNTVQRFNISFGIHALARGGAASLDATITNNLVDTPGPIAADGIRVESGGGVAGESNAVCLNITGNSSNTLAFDEGYELQQYTGTTFELQGFDASDCGGNLCDGTVARQVEEFILDNNTRPSGTPTANVRTAGRIVNYTAGTCDVVPTS